MKWNQPKTAFRFFALTFLILGGLSTGCSTGQKKTAVTESASTGAPSKELKSNPSPYRAPVQSPEVSGSEGVYNFRGLTISQKDYDFPVIINDSVAFWIDYFNGRGRKYFEKYLERSELFVPYIQPILKQYGLPQDLVYLAMIESGFANHAKSQAKAVGPWQFMPFTGRRYGLQVNWWVDERRDTEKSTHSAAKYLKDLYTMFDSWELAASAYNSGEMKITRAIQRYGTTDYWTLTRQNFLRRETRDYVPKIMAAAIVAKNRTFFGFQASGQKPKKGEVLAPNGEVVRIENESAQTPGLAAKEALESVLKTGEGSSVASGEDEEEEAEEELIAADGDIEPVPPAKDDGKTPVALARPIQTPHVNRNGELVGEELLDFELDGPADLMKISRAANLSYHTVKGLNPEILRWCTPPQYKKYTLRLPASCKDEFLKNYNSPDFQKRVEFLTFRINKPQSLASVARRFGLKVDPLAELNKMPAQMILRKGALVRLPIPSEGERNVANLDLRDPPEKTRSRNKRRRRRSASAQTEPSVYERSSRVANRAH